MTHFQRNPLFKQLKSFRFYEWEASVHTIFFSKRFKNRCGINFLFLWQIVGNTGTKT